MNAGRGVPDPPRKIRGARKNRPNLYSVWLCFVKTNTWIWPVLRGERLWIREYGRATQRPKKTESAIRRTPRPCSVCGSPRLCRRRKRRLIGARVGRWREEIFGVDVWPCGIVCCSLCGLTHPPSIAHVGSEPMLSRKQEVMSAGPSLAATSGLFAVGMKIRHAAYVYAIVCVFCEAVACALWVYTLRRRCRGGAGAGCACWACMGCWAGGKLA